ncbi:DUF4352 domain-containing protein [Streptomyces sp. NPDC018031]|uniref:DUF4352 domain-containing protein n=1 Tax=Streptomyces sp. NPDC018031 TaxID=3365033 RepID=UPI0037A0546B
MRTRTIAALVLAACLPLTGCGGDEDKQAEKPKAAPSDFDCTKQDVSQAEWMKHCSDEGTPPEGATEEPAEGAPPAALSVGESGTFTVADVDGNQVATFEVTVDEAEYVGASEEEAGTSLPAEGQYLRLGLTLKNVKGKPADIMTYGQVQWEDADTAAQDATTLNTVDGPDLDTTYKPGQGVTGKLILDVPERGGTLTYLGDGSGFSVKLPK